MHVPRAFENPAQRLWLRKQLKGKAAVAPSK
jgi:hypothetical protein